MFDIGWQEMFLVAVLALIVIGPKDLPRALKTITGMIRKVRGMARDFQSGLDDIVRETELADMRKEIEAGAGGDLRKEIEESLDPDGDVAKDLDDMRRIEGDLTKAAQGYADDVAVADDNVANTPVEAPSAPSVVSSDADVRKD